MSAAVMLLLVACGSVKNNPEDAASPSIDAPPPTDAPSDGPSGFPSCADLTASCGAGASTSCCATAMVPGGTYLRGYDDAPDAYNDMTAPAMVSTFTLDRYEVTVGRFRAFVAAGMGTQAHPPAQASGAHASIAGSGWDTRWNAMLMADTPALAAAVKCGVYQTWTDTPGANENNPMNCVSWYEAMAFCIWDGGYLPTEAEWNYAASGGSEQRAYPWSSPASSTAIDCTYATYNVNSPPGTACVGGAAARTSPVGSESPRGDGRWGHADLAGNVWEWTLDLDASSYPLPCNDCADVTTGTARVFRGGAFGNVGAILRTANRISTDPMGRADVGMRCARKP